MLRTALWTSIGAALCLLLMETVLSITTVNGTGLLALIASINLVLIPVVLPLSLFFSMSLQLLKGAWLRMLSPREFKPVHALCLSLYAAVILSSTLKLGLWVWCLVHRRF